MLWIKSLHIIAVICWFAGIFYLPRLFVYHAMSDDASTREHLQLMQHKLYRFMSPFAVLTVVFGGWLASYNLSYYMNSSWFYLKLVGVVGLIGYHLLCGYYVKQLQAGNNKHSHVFFRWFNELPVLLMFAIVILVVVKPFA
jgi:putative membrane protein